MRQSPVPEVRVGPKVYKGVEAEAAVEKDTFKTQFYSLQAHVVETMTKSQYQ